MGFKEEELNLVQNQLQKYLQAKAKVNMLVESIEELENKATSCTSILSLTPKGSSVLHDKVAEYAAMIADKKAEYLDDIIELEKVRNEIESNILELEQPYQNILYARYILGKNVAKIASNTGYEMKYTYLLHKIGLEQYKDLVYGQKEYMTMEEVLKELKK